MRSGAGMARCPQKQCPLLCPLLFACAANSSALLQAQTQKEGYPWDFDAAGRIILSLEVFQFFHVICFLRRFTGPRSMGVSHHGEMQKRARGGEWTRERRVQGQGRGARRAGRVRTPGRRKEEEKNRARVRWLRQGP